MPNGETPTGGDRAHDPAGRPLPRTASYTDEDEKIFGEAERVFRLTDSLIILLMTALSGGVIGFFFAGSVDLALASFVSLLVGLAFGWAVWHGIPRRTERSR